MLIKMSKHATQDRIDRLLFIYDNVGIGEPYIDSVEDDILYTITTTGVLLVRSASDGTLITAYIADIDKITAIWRNKHGERPMPDNLYKRVLANAFFDRMWNKQEKEKKKPFNPQTKCFIRFGESATACLKRQGKSLRAQE